jgi:glycine/D-amino acid oxidase-like deaminating enzyme
MRRGSPRYSSRCGWNALLPPGTTTPLSADRDCEVAIVGAGYSGVAAARRWAELRPQDRILLLDALPLGEGNAGRNSGFLLEVSLAEDADAAAVSRMAQCNRLLRQTMAQIREHSDRAPLPCELVQRGTYRAAVGAAGRRALAAYRGFLDAAGLAYEPLAAAELRARLGTGFYSEGLYSPDCYLAQPAALIRALASTLPATVTLCEDSPVTALDPAGDGWELQAGDHRVRAGQVLLTNNAFAARLHRGADRLVAMYTCAALTEALPPEELERLGSDQHWGLLPAHKFGATLRRTADGRLLIRALHRYEREPDQRATAAALSAGLARRFPQLERLPLAQVWSGAVGYTQGGGALWGALAPGLWITAGCNGGGVVKGTLFGRALAEKALGEPTDDIPGLFGRAKWLPPEPLRQLGYAVAAGWQSIQGRAEAQGRRAGTGSR